MSFPRYERYKESGVEWLGEVPEGWEVKRLKRNFRLLTEKTDRREHPVALENIESWSGRFIETETEFQGDGVAFNAGDVLFGKLRPYLAKALLADQSGEAVGDFHVMRPSLGVAGRFALYQILNQDFISIVDGSTFGAKMPRVSWDFMANLMQAIPPLPEQHTIAAFLDRETGKIDTLVAEQERLIGLLKEKRQTVISHAVTKGLNPDAPMKDSGIEWLGEVPEGWEVKRLNNLVSSIKAGPFGSALTKDMYVSSGYRVYGQEQVIPEDFSIGDYYISPEKFIELQQYKVSPGDILISCVGTFGKIAIVPKDIELGIINPRLIRMRCADSVSGEYLATLLRSGVVFEQFSFLSRGGTMDIINIGILSEIFLVVPPIEEQSAIVAFLDSETVKIDELVSEAQKAIGLFKERRSALISAAVTGKIKITASDRSDLSDSSEGCQTP